MNRARYGLLVIGWLLCGVLFAADEPGKQVPPTLLSPDGLEVNAILASVNGEPISLVDILPMTRRREYQAYAAYTGERLFEEVRKIRLTAVDEMIDRKLMLAEYKPELFVLSEQDVEESLDRMADASGCRNRREFERRARESGTSIDELRKQAREQLICQLMLMRQVRIEENVTPKESYEYFQSHPEEFTTPERLELAMIQLPETLKESDEEVVKLAGELAADPARFAELAAMKSVGPGAKEGGSLGWIERQRLRPEFAAAMLQPETGKIYGPITTIDGVIFLKLLHYEQETKADFRSVSAAIRERIKEERRSLIRLDYLKKLREKAVIRYFF